PGPKDEQEVERIAKVRQHRPDVLNPKEVPDRPYHHLRGGNRGKRPVGNGPKNSRFRRLRRCGGATCGRTQRPSGPSEAGEENRADQSTGAIARRQMGRDRSRVVEDQPGVSPLLKSRTARGE